MQMAEEGRALNDQYNRAMQRAQLNTQSPMARMFEAGSGERAARGAADAELAGTVNVDWEDSLRRGAPVRMPVDQLLATTKAYVDPTGAARRGKSVREVLENLFGTSARQRKIGDSLTSKITTVENDLAKVGEKAAALTGAEERVQGVAARARGVADEAEGQIPELEARIAATTGEVDELKGIVRDRATAYGQAQRAANEYAFKRNQIESVYTRQMRDHDMQLGRLRDDLATARREMVQAKWSRRRAERTLNDAIAIRKTLSNSPAQSWAADVEAVARQIAATRTDPQAQGELTATLTALQAALREEAAIVPTENAAKAIANQIADWTTASRAEKVSGKSLVTPVTLQLLRDGWQEMAPLILQRDADSLVVASELAAAMKHVETALQQSDVWGLVDKYTAFFKTYATVRPGFHVRNIISGVFMNIVAGVGVNSMVEAMPVWKEFRANPTKFWATTTERNRNALLAVFGSGAGGQFAENVDIFNRSTKAGRRVYNGLMNNPLTRFNRKWGEYNESVMRLGMALSSMDRGESVVDAMQRITKYHFNYGQVSKMDRTMKKMVPFWTFMSRNFPLQLEQMWANPRTYLWYQSFARNFAGDSDPYTPDYWLAQGAFTTSLDAEDQEKPWYLSPDLPHLRIAEPFVAAAQGDWGKAGFSDINPLALAPIEALVTQEKTYTGAPIDGYEETSPIMRALIPLLSALPGNLTATGGESGKPLIDQRVAHLIRSLIPPVDIAERAIPGGVDDESVRSGRTLETWLRNFGLPVYNLTPQLRKQQRQSEYFDQRDALEAQREIASM